MLSVRERAELVAETDAMASHVTVRIVHDGDRDLDAVVADALDVFHDVDRTCTRFDRGSDLMRANAARGDWVSVSSRCYDALVEAHAAYRRTGARFDPRVLADLVRLGYDRSMRLGPPAPRTASVLAPRPPMPAWRPEFRPAERQVRLGPAAVDLGGIGKGLAVRWAADRVRAAADSFLIEAGGDCYCQGSAADGGPWRVAIEDPRGEARPVAVVELRDAAIATSSVRVRQWRIDGHEVHHLIDPLTGQPGGDGLLSVTVVDTDPAAAEVWSKVLFLTGRRGVRTSAEHFGVAAVWVDTDGAVGWSRPASEALTWTATS